MKIHIIVDFTFLYYKYKFAVESGRVPKRIADGIDISQEHYIIKEIEGFREKRASFRDDVVVSVCFDMPSMRNEDATNGYKETRKKSLSDEDFEVIDKIGVLLQKAGYNIYKEVGYEADDLIANLVRLCEDKFDYTWIHTPDADLITYVSNKVGVSRYKSGKGYTNITVGNFNSYLSAEYKCNFPYNAVLLYKSTVGDKSDNIKGIRGFGAKAFEGLVNHLDAEGIEWERMGDYSYVRECLNKLSGYLGESKTLEALASFDMIVPIELEGIRLPENNSTKDRRMGAYSGYRIPNC